MLKVFENVKHLLCLALLIVTLSASAQSNLIGTYWHDGEYFYPVETENDTAIWVNTLSLHEGGMAIPWLKTDKPNVFKYCYRERDNGTGNTEICDSIVHTYLDGQELMLIYGEHKKLDNVLIRYDGQSKEQFYAFSHGFDSIQEKDIRTRIKGLYSIAGTTMKWTFTDDSILVSGATSSSLIKRNIGYSTLWEMDYPTQVLKLDDGRYLYYEFTLNGLDLFKGISHHEADGFEWVTKGRLYYHLDRHSQNEKTPGHWPEASTMILTRGYLSKYPTDVLRYMRNEIYARNGYRFSDEQLFNYFSQSGNWYHPIENQSELNLSPIEKLNIQLIRSIEEDKMKQ